MSTNAEFTLLPGVWTEVSTDSVSTVIQNMSNVDIIVRTGNTAPANTVKTGILLEPKKSQTFTSDVTTENCYARILNDNSSNASIFVWS